MPWSTRKGTRVQFSQTKNRDCFFILMETRIFSQFLQSLHFALTQHPPKDHVCDFWATAGASAPCEGTPLIPVLRGFPPSREKCSTCSLPQGPTPSLQEKVGTFPGTSTHFWSGPGRSTHSVPTAQRQLSSSCPIPPGPSGSP